MHLEWLSLESKYLEESEKFYRNVLDLDVVDKTPNTKSFQAGNTVLRLVKPSVVPRGGVHTHYAFSAPRSEYGDWIDRIEETLEFTPFEHEFGSSSSMYFYDPDRHCVEIGGRDDSGEGITGIFEVVIEVENLENSMEFYSALGGSVIDDPGDEDRVRLSFGGFDLEIWEPRLGIADGQGGLHVDFGVSPDEEDVDMKYLSEHSNRQQYLEDGVKFRDSDGHYITVSDH
ncbi:MAG: VOC family protein [Halobacteria archaeon]